MALMQELDPKIQGDKLTEESMGLKPHGELIRDYQPEPNTKWRFGLPNYARVNRAYFEHRAKNHPEGSLEAVVQKVVKNWEVESHHISDIHQWKTMDISKFQAALNGGCPASAQLMCDIGPYNMLVGETKEYSAKANTFESANSIFSHAFNEGFAWEVLEVLSGPPAVTFKWRHFGRFSGTYTDKQGRKYAGNGDMINVIGLCIAKVNDNLVIEALDVYYNPDDMMKPLVTHVKKEEGEVPVKDEDTGHSKAQHTGCSGDKKCEGCGIM